MSDLIFSRPPYAGGPVNLVFGATDVPALVPVSVVGSSALGGISGSGAVVLVPMLVAVSGVSDLGGVSGSGQALYNNRNPRRASTRAVLPFQPATPRPGGTAAGWGQSARLLAQPASTWGKAAPTVAGPATPWTVATSKSTQRSTAWALGEQRATQAQAVHQAAAPRHTQAQARWQTGQGRALHAALVHQAALSLVRQARAPWQPARTMQVLVVARNGRGVARLSQLLTPWQVARPVPAGRDVWPPVQPPNPPRVPNTHLLFACPPWAGGPVHLVFGHVCLGPRAPIYILPARFYMAVHQIEAKRLPDNTPIGIFDVSLSADAGSWAWTFSASCKPAAFELLAPSAGIPAMLQITLDGLEWVFVVDSLQRQESFGQRSVKVAGRSATAIIGQPYARTTSRLSNADYTAQQLAAQAVDLTDVDVDWGIDDWLVPSGAWSHSGTPLQAVQAIAEAAGGYVNSHRSQPTLLVRHPYPTLPGGIPGGPWNWGSATFGADVELAPDAIITTGIERKDGPDIDGVWVSGTTQGVLAHVKRTGTAGAKLSSMITDALITDPIAAQQRGLSVLGAAGAKHTVQINLPVLTGASQPGVLDVGQLVQINESTPWRGRVRSVNVAASKSVRQTVTLERHL